MSEYAPGEEPQGNRKERRRKFKNRGFTKKGNTRVIRRDEQGKLWNIPTPVGSRIHNMAKSNVKKMHRQRKEAKHANEQRTGGSADAPPVSER